MAEAAQLGLDILYCQYLSVFTHFSPVLELRGLQPEVKPVFLVIAGDEKQHGCLELLLNLEVVAYLLPVLIDVAAELIVCQEVYFVAAVIVAKAVGIVPKRLHLLALLFHEVGELLRSYKRQLATIGRLNCLGLQLFRKGGADAVDVIQFEVLVE